MKISQLISELEKIKSERGDLPCVSLNKAGLWSEIVKAWATPNSLLTGPDKILDQVMFASPEKGFFKPNNKLSERAPKIS